MRRNLATRPAFGIVVVVRFLDRVPRESLSHMSVLRFWVITSVTVDKPEIAAIPSKVFWLADLATGRECRALSYATE